MTSVDGIDSCHSFWLTDSLLMLQSTHCVHVNVIGLVLYLLSARAFVSEMVIDILDLYCD